MKEVTIMASRIKIRLILELNASGMSQNDIARTRHISRSSISTVMRIAKEKDITYGTCSGLTTERILEENKLHIK